MSTLCPFSNLHPLRKGRGSQCQVIPQAARAYFTHLPVGRVFQQYRESFKIGQKQFYTQVNDKEG